MRRALGVCAWALLANTVEESPAPTIPQVVPLADRRRAMLIAEHGADKGLELSKLADEADRLRLQAGIRVVVRK